jgi:hypothetical protein
MTKIAFSLFCLLCLTFNSFSQDVIFLKTGDEIKSKVEEISETTVKYRKFENLSGPLYAIDIQKIFMIKYENGTKEMFDKNTSSSNSMENDKELAAPIVKQKQFSKLSVREIFSTGKLVIGLEGLRCSVISFDGSFLGMYFVDALGKTYQYKLVKINENGYTEIELKGNKSPIEYFDNSIGFSQDSKQFYAFTTNMEVYIWSTESGELLKKLEGSTKDSKSPYVFVPNGAFNYNSSNGSVESESFIIFSDYLYKFNGVISGQFKNCASVIKLLTSPSVITFSKDNQLMAVAGTFAKKTNIYDTKTGQSKIELNSIEKSINEMSFTAANDYLIISEKFFMSKSDIKNGTSSTLFSIDKSCYNMDVNCNNVLAYSIVPSNSAQLWDLNSNKVLVDLPKLFSTTYELVFSYDGNRLFAVSSRGEVICWELLYE